MKRKLLVGLLAAAFAVSALAQTAVIPSVESVGNRVASYNAAITITPAATPTDIITISGSATRTVYVKSVSLACQKTTFGYSPVTLVKRSTATSHVSATAITSSASDSSNSAATAVVNEYSAANPTLGTGVSHTVTYVPFALSTTAGDLKPATFLWGDLMDQYIVLRGTAQQLAINLNAATLTGAICYATVRWLEK